MGRHKLENYFGDRLSQHKEHIDKDELWNSLGLDEEPKREKPVWFRLFGVGLIIIVLGLGSYLYVNRDGSSVNGNTKIESPQEAVYTKKNDNVTEYVFKDEVGFIDNDVSSPDSKPALIRNTFEKQATVRTFVSRTFPDKMEVKTSLIVTTTEINTEPNSSSSLRTSSLSSDIAETKNLQSIEMTHLSIESRLISSLYAVKSIQPRLIHRDVFSHSINDSYLTSQLFTCRSLKEQLWSIGGYAMLFKTNRTLDALSSSTPLQNYLEEREASETVLETLIVGGFLRRQIASNTYLKLGLEYQSITERFENVSIVDTSFTENAVAFNAKVLKEARTFNSHRLINVPLTLGYTTNFGKWNIIAELSPVFTLNQSFGGLFLEADNTLTQNTSTFKTGFSVAGRVAIGISYRHNDNWTFAFLPTYQQHFQSFARADSGYEQKYSLFGSQLVAKYGF